MTDMTDPTTEPTPGQLKTKAAREARHRIAVTRKAPEWVRQLEEIGWTCTPPEGWRP